MKESPRRPWRLLAVGALAVLLGACASPRKPAPVEIREPVPRSAVPSAPSDMPSTPDGAALPGAENAGKPGYYTVKPGDTMIRIGLEQGQNWRDIARWNNIANPNQLEVGQVLRVSPPGAVATTPAPPAARPVEARPATPAPTTPAATTGAVAQPVVPGGGAAPAGTPPTVAAAPAAPRDPDEEIVWIWPANGPIGAPFDDTRNKGLSILGRAGDPVVAAADGRVVYSGAGLRGYGNLLIVKHNNAYLSAYAHNQVLLVKEDQVVRRGQKIAEMGSTDAERVQLHFEIRRQGRPVDPAKLLPPR